MAKPKLGTKRQCLSCAAKFYDLNKEPITCPKCETVFEPEILLPPKAQRKPDKPQVEEPEPTEKKAAEKTGVEVISLDEADAEAQPDEDLSALEDAGDLPEVETEEASEEEANDNTFLETDDEDAPDVTGLIGGGHAKKEGES